MLPGLFQPMLMASSGLNISSLFSTTLFTSTGAAQTITTGLNGTLGALSWTKPRGASGSHLLFDTARGQNYLLTDTTGAQAADSTFTFTSTGITDAFGPAGGTAVNWQWIKSTRFFDIVTYTGTGTAQAINHNLGIKPGMMVVKQIDGTRPWTIYNQALTATSGLGFTTAASVVNSAYWNNTEPTATQFTVGNQISVNASGGSYVAYLFAHDTASDGVIQCGSYTGNGSTTGPVVTLGWQPQFLMIKGNLAANWLVYDNKRDVSDPRSTSLAPNTSAIESSTNPISFTSTGFQPLSSGTVTNSSGTTYYYMAIKG